MTDHNTQARQAWIRSQTHLEIERARAIQTLRAAGKYLLDVRVQRNGTLPPNAWHPGWRAS